MRFNRWVLPQISISVILCEAWYLEIRPRVCCSSKCRTRTPSAPCNLLIRMTTQGQANENEDPAPEKDRPIIKNPSLWFSSDKSLPLTPAQESLQRYVESVKASMSESNDFETTEGVDCEGEPSVDPSRQVQSQGDSEWMDDW